jgi:hypothetical protein
MSRNTPTEHEAENLVSGEHRHIAREAETLRARRPREAEGVFAMPDIPRSARVPDFSRVLASAAPAPESEQEAALSGRGSAPVSDVRASDVRGSFSTRTLPPSARRRWLRDASTGSALLAVAGGMLLAVGFHYGQRRLAAEEGGMGTLAAPSPAPAAAPEPQEAQALGPRHGDVRELTPGSAGPKDSAGCGRVGPEDSQPENAGDDSPGSVLFERAVLDPGPDVGDGRIGQGTGACQGIERHDRSDDPFGGDDLSE